jgi:hypothetical protein
VRLRKSEIQSLSNELDEVVKAAAELQRSSPRAKVQLPTGGVAARDMAVPMSPGAASSVVRRLSHENVQDAEEELAQVLQQLDETTNEITGRVKKRRIFLMLFLATAVLCSPGLLLSLRGLGVVDIREGTVLWQSVLAWEYAFEWIRVAGRRVMSSALMLTACVIAPPPPAYKFNVRHPPLLALHGSFMSSHSADRRGRDITATPEVLVGEASLKVCAIGTSNQSFYR